jgi:hypothetical protein
VPGPSPLRLERRAPSVYVPLTATTWDWQRSAPSTVGLERLVILGVRRSEKIDQAYQADFVAALGVAGPATRALAGPAAAHRSWNCSARAAASGAGASAAATRARMASCTSCAGRPAADSRDEAGHDQPFLPETDRRGTTRHAAERGRLPWDSVVGNGPEAMHPRLSHPPGQSSIRTDEIADGDHRPDQAAQMS